LNSKVVEPSEVIKSTLSDMEVTMDFIADFEGYKDCAYWDVKQWSI